MHFAAIKTGGDDSHVCILADDSGNPVLAKNGREIRTKQSAMSYMNIQTPPGSSKMARKKRVPKSKEHITSSTKTHRTKAKPQEPPDEGQSFTDDGDKGKSNGSKPKSLRGLKAQVKIIPIELDSRLLLLYDWDKALFPEYTGDFGKWISDIVIGYHKQNAHKLHMERLFQLEDLSALGQK